MINILHELGHLVDNLWGDLFTRHLKYTEFTSRDYHAGWDGSAYQRLDRETVYREALLSGRVGGGNGRAWQQIPDDGTPYYEDWADIFANGVIGNINLATDLGWQMNNFYQQMRNYVMGDTP